MLEKLETVEKNYSLSEKVDLIVNLPDIDNKEMIVREIEALEKFTKEERASVFRNDSILWIIKNFSIKELKERALSVLNKPEVNVGDVIKSKDGFRAVVLEVCGTQRDRLTLMSVNEGRFEIKEGCSVYDVSLNHHHYEIKDMLNLLSGITLYGYDSNKSDSGVEDDIPESEI